MQLDEILKMDIEEVGIFLKYEIRDLSDEEVFYY